jgi:multicomponent Na+:H+ antiporter subunit G
MTVLDVMIAALSIAGASLVLISALAMMRERDAYARINVLSPATGMGLPLIVVAAYLHQLTTSGFSGAGLVKLLITLAALLVVSSVASNTLARAAYLSGAPVDPATRPQDLAQEPPAEEAPR